jgi:hypothetical protein
LAWKKHGERGKVIKEKCIQPSLDLAAAKANASLSTHMSFKLARSRSTHHVASNINSFSYTYRHKVTTTVAEMVAIHDGCMV